MSRSSLAGIVRGSGRAIVAATAAAVRFVRKSLQFRVVVSTMILTTVAVFGVGSWMSEQVADGLFQTRLASASKQADTMARSLQSVANPSGGSQDDVTQALQAAMQNQVTTATLPLRAVALRPVPGNATAVGNFSAVSPNQPAFSVGQLTPEFVKSVATSGGTQRYQSIALTTYSGNSRPGLAIGTLITIPGSGQYQFYVISDLSNEQDTLSLVERSMVVAALILVVLVGAVAWVVARIVVRPVRAAADVSQELAAGDLGQRLRIRGTDDLAVLATSFNHMASNLQNQIVRLENLSALQQRFVSDVSHELRTPLTTIRVAADMIYESREDLDPMSQRSAELLHGQVQRFELLLADLLEISRFDSGAAELDAEAEDMLAVVGRVIENNQVIAERSGYELKLHAAATPCMADVDARRIERIVRNLIVNALEHGENKPIDIYLAADADAVAVSVRDHGVGMDREQVRRVFDRFWRADPARPRTLGGSGLGLAIALEDAHLHSGWLQAWGRPGEGACFRLTIPRRAGHELSSSPLPLPPGDAGPDPADFEQPAATDEAQPAGPRTQTGSLPRLDTGGNDENA